MRPKVTPSGSKMEQKVVQKRSRRPSRKMSFFCVLFRSDWLPKRTPKRTRKSYKTDLGVFLHSKKSTNFWKLFFLFFEASGRSQTLKIELKRCTVVQKRGSHLFAKNCTFSTKWIINDAPWDPKDVQKRRKTWENAVGIWRSFFGAPVGRPGEGLAAGVGPIGGGGGFASQLCRELCLHI